MRCCYFLNIRRGGVGSFGVLSDSSPKGGEQSQEISLAVFSRRLSFLFFANASPEREGERKKEKVDGIIEAGKGSGFLRIAEKLLAGTKTGGDTSLANSKRSFLSLR